MPQACKALGADEPKRAGVPALGIKQADGAKALSNHQLILNRLLEYRDSRLLARTGLVVLPMLFEIAAGKHVLSSEEVRVFLRGLRQIVRF